MTVYLALTSAPGPEPLIRRRRVSPSRRERPRLPDLSPRRRLLGVRVDGRLASEDEGSRASCGTFAYACSPGARNEARVGEVQLSGL